MYGEGFQRFGRRLWLVRDEDESGVSGTGVVADGVMFPSGAVVLEWRNDVNDNIHTAGNGLAVYPGENGLDDAIAVHGHEGRTSVVFKDDPEAEQLSVPDGIGVRDDGS